MVVVVAAVIQRGDRILIGQRKAGGRHALKWEFPGGKVEPGEEPRAALARELREELAIQAVIADRMDGYAVQYPGGPVTHLIFYRVKEFSGEPVNLDFERIVWEQPARLMEYDFLEGDAAFLQKLVKAAEA